MSALKVGWIIFVITAAVSFYVIGTAPAGIEVPVHWGADGNVDRYGSVMEAMLVPPGAMALVLGIISALKWFEPRQENLKRSNTARGWIALSVVLLMMVLHAGTVALVYGYEAPMLRLVFFGIGLTLTVMGNFLSKIRSNFFLGIRTPWTLSSDEVWRKTHRLAGKLFMLAGLLLLASAWIVSENSLTYAVVGLVLPAALIPAIYSWWLWKKGQNG